MKARRLPDPRHPPPPQRLALQPLLDALPIDQRLARPDVPGPGVPAQAAQLLGVSVRTIHRWRRTGLNPWAADRAAITAGHHPYGIWGPDWIAPSTHFKTSPTRDPSPDYGPQSPSA